MGEASRYINHSLEIPFLVRRLDVSSTGPIDGDGSLGIVPDVTLVLVKCATGTDFKTRRGCNGNFGLRGSFNGRDFGFVGYLYANDGTKFAAFRKAAYEAVACWYCKTLAIAKGADKLTEDICKFLIIKLRYGVERHLVSDRRSLISHLHRDDIVEIGLLDFVLIYNGSTSRTFDSTVFDRGRRGYIQCFNNV